MKIKNVTETLSGLLREETLVFLDLDERFISFDKKILILRLIEIFSASLQLCKLILVALLVCNSHYYHSVQGIPVDTSTSGILDDIYHW